MKPSTEHVQLAPDFGKLTKVQLIEIYKMLCDFEKSPAGIMLKGAIRDELDESYVALRSLLHDPATAPEAVVYNGRLDVLECWHRDGIGIASQVEGRIAELQKEERDATSTKTS